MALNLNNIIVVFSASVDQPKRMVPIQTVQMSKLDVPASPAVSRAGADDSKHQLIFTPFNEAQPLDSTSKIIVNFASSPAGLTARDAAYAAVLAACTSV